MKITTEEVLKIAALARLRLDDEKLTVFAEQFDAILGYMEKLNEVDTTGVPPMYTPVKHTTVLREDIVRSDYSRAEILRNAPEDDGQYFIVPKII